MSAASSGGAALAAFALCVCAVSAARAEIRLGARVGTEVYTVDRRRENASGDGIQETFSSVVPSLRLSATSRASRLDLDAGATYRRSLDTGADSVEPRLALGALVRSPKRALLFELRATSVLRDTSSQSASRALADDGGREAPGTPIDPELEAADEPSPDLGLLGDAVLAEPDDGRFSRVDSVRLGPSFGRRLGERHRVDAAYRFGIDRAEDDALVGTRSHSVGLGSRSWLDDRASLALQLRLDADRTQALEGDPEADAVAADATLVRAFGPRLGTSVSAGHERIRVRASDLGSADTAGSDDGEVDVDQSAVTYGAAVHWRPSPRVRIDGSWTERAFGGSPAASIAVGGRHSSVRLDWRRDLALGRDTGIATVADAPAGVVDAAGAPGGADPGAAVSAPTVGEAVFARDLLDVDERLVLSWNRTGRVTSLSVSLAQVRRRSIDDERSAPSSRAYGAELAVRRALGRRTTLSFDARYGLERNERSGDEQDGGTGGGDLRSVRVGLGLSVQLR